MVFFLLPTYLLTLLYHLSRCQHRLSVRVSPSLSVLSPTSSPSLLHCFHLPTCVSHLFECVHSDFRSGLSLLVLVLYQWSTLSPTTGPSMYTLSPLILVLWSSHNTVPTTSASPFLVLGLAYLRLSTLMLVCLSLSSLLSPTSGHLTSWWPHLLLVSNLYPPASSSSLCLVSLLAQLYLVEFILRRLSSYRLLVSVVMLLGSWLLLSLSVYHHNSTLSLESFSLPLHLTPTLLCTLSQHLPHPTPTLPLRVLSSTSLLTLLLLTLCPHPFPPSPTNNSLVYLFTTLLSVSFHHLEAHMLARPSPLGRLLSAQWFRPPSRLVLPAAMLTSTLFARELSHHHHHHHHQSFLPTFVFVSVESLALSCLLWCHLVHPLAKVFDIATKQSKESTSTCVEVAVILTEAPPGVSPRR